MLAADAMLSYVRSHTPYAREVLRQARWYFSNHEELAALGGDQPQAFRRRWSLDGLVVKSGPAGVTAFTDSGELHIPALTNQPVVDTTGAGDAVAAGMLAHWLVAGSDPEGLLESLVWGVACASITISDIGLRAIAAATREQLEERVEEVKTCLRES
jgi:sugar/nucleoside kinase (ribokinase family)